MSEYDPLSEYDPSAPLLDEENDDNAPFLAGGQRDIPEAEEGFMGTRAGRDIFDPVSFYFRDISKFKVLTQEEEKRLAFLSAEGDQEARAQMIRGNLRLVVSIAKRYSNQGLPILDLIEEGNLGLIRAVEKFDPFRGYKLSTYATWWIKQYILRALAKYSNTIRLPINMSESMNRFLRILRNLIQRLGRDPTSEELATELNVPPVKIMQMLHSLQQNISIETYLDQRGMQGQDTLEDEAAGSPMESIIKKNRQRYIELLLGVIDIQERDIIQMRFGLVDGEPKTLEEIGRRYGVTRERIRQIEGSALKKLRRFLIRHNVKINELL